MTEWEYRDLLEKQEKQELLRREELIKDARKEARSDAFVQCKDIVALCAIIFIIAKCLIIGSVFDENKLLFIISGIEAFFWLVGCRFILWLKE